MDANAILLDALGPDFSWPRDIVLRQPRNVSTWDDLRRQVLYRMRIAASGSTVGEGMIDSTLKLRSRIEEELKRRDSR
jgi:hypothetical protein